MSKPKEPLGEILRWILMIEPERMIEGCRRLVSHLSDDDIWDYGLGILREATLCSDRWEIADAIIKRVKVDWEDSFGATPLHFAARTDEPALVHDLIKRGAKVDRKDKYGCTPLHWAGASAVIDVLLKKGAAITSRDGMGNTPLHTAVKEKRPDAVKCLLEHEADVNCQNYEDETPLHLATGPRTAARLIEKGADINREDRLGNTPLHEAAENGRIPIVELLLKKGAEPNFGNNEGDTPLHIAAQRGRLRIVKLLLANGADPDIENESGVIPLQFAPRSSTTKKFLKEHRNNKEI
jgi:ankyrin repeat protein